LVDEFANRGLWRAGAAYSSAGPAIEQKPSRGRFHPAVVILGG